MKVLGALMVLLMSGLISFGVFACVGILICWAFGIVFNVKVVFGIWIVYILLRGMCK